MWERNNLPCCKGSENTYLGEIGTPMSDEKAYSHLLSKNTLENKAIKSIPNMVW